MPRFAVAHLTDAQARAFRPGRAPIDVRDGRSPGLILSVLPSGRKVWSVRYRANGRQRRLTLGEFPALSLSLARGAAGDARTKIRHGEDIAVTVRATKAKPTDTIEALATQYLEKHARRKKKTAAEDERVLNRDVLPYWRTLSVRSLTRRDVREILERIFDRKAPIMANRALEIIRKMLNWGVDHDWIDANPAARIQKLGVETSRDRVLTDDEIRSLWRCLSHFPATVQKQAPGRRRATGPTGDPFCPLSPALAAVQKIRLLTAQRGGEVVRMRWSDLDLDAGWWMIPAEHSKNGRQHRVPLTPETISIIKAQRRGATTKSNKDSKQEDGYVFTGRTGAIVEARVRKAGAALSRVLGFEMRSHDLRRTAATKMAEAGVPPAHISRVLNHIQGGPSATRVYDRYSYDNEKRTALDSWANMLIAILKKEPTGDKVVPMTKRA